MKPGDVIKPTGWGENIYLMIVRQREDGFASVFEVDAESGQIAETTIGIRAGNNIFCKIGHVNLEGLILSEVRKIAERAGDQSEEAENG